MYKTMYAVIQVISNEETIIKTLLDKDSALSFWRSCKDAAHSGVMACVQADFDEELRMKDNTCRVFEVG